jgi:hypothetical protein
MNEALSREEELFDAARRISNPAQRHSFLNQACDGDEALRDRLEKLLSALPAADEMFQECLSAVRSSAEEADLFSANRSIASEEVPGDCIGSYRLVTKIGEGGCGVVYLAEQQQPVRRRVAVKVIKLGMDTRSVVARFNAERQALAMMDHPNIAKVFDGGATTAGRPYFVMELVSGVKITEFCDKTGLDTRDRLTLFAQVCLAIQHAHQKGVIHRDVKPSNILVAWQDGRPTPKVIDFGVAKATADRLTDNTIFTMQTQLIGTPAYMSPEQAELSGLDIDTRSDIYSLGVVLYELMTGRTPFDPQKLLQSGVDELRRRLRDQEPLTPSATVATLRPADLAAVAQSRQIEPHKLIGQLRGDLDWIVMKALEKDRGRRYQTANGLAMDVQRFLNNEPIVARPPSRLYQFKKLARRNTGLFVSIGAVAVVLIAGLATSTWLLRREVQARRWAVDAEQREARLRHQAETREKITQAAILLNQEKLGEADSLIDNIEVAAPTTEGATVFRAIGEWHALAGRWKTAAQRFNTLVLINQAEGWDLASVDFLECGTTLAQIGDAIGYQQFHQTSLNRFMVTTNPVIAERILKINLLLPADATFTESLAPLARVAAQPVAGDENGDAQFRAAWRSVSLALFEYRRGRYVTAADWCKKCLAYSEYNAPRIATARIILALAWQRQDRSDEARGQLSQGRQLIDAKFASDLDRGTAQQGFWFDWVFARILLREAQTLSVKA